ncbi:TOMM precursor leader peptide-binding protein [Streptomyces sp. H27-D2]|uniref:TOMM precursor leader peptide-binding protein n=1 Tax=Streptomyces sp. H27-D2 TaxID=3046304 RepID=UPI002DB7994F|nr:TOMM precursor leader peptide-binding protein [Streptomyces sp. H27-D2]MEC4017643.1 TOMM precursor leader peptide-binding protein [Streptomyces sp. H27-D2]
MTLGPSPKDPLVGFKQHLRAEAVAGEAVYLLSAGGVTALHGPHIEALAPLLDGTRTLSTVLKEASATMPMAEAGRAVGRLAEAKLIGYRAAARGGRVDSAVQAYWDLAGLESCAAEESIARTSVSVLTVGRADPEAAHAACRAAGLTVSGAGGGPAAPDGAADFLLVLCDDYLAPELAELDAGCRAAGRPWLLAKPYGAETWVGPVFTPAKGPCWSCLAQRLRGHRAAEGPVQRALRTDRPLPVPEASLAAGRAMGLQAAVLETAKWVAGMRHPGQQAVYVVDTFNLRARHHPVSRRPQCPECGDPELVAERVRRPFVPVSRPKAAHTGGNHRTLRTEEVLSRYRHLIGPVTGIVTEIRPAPGAPAGINCSVSGPNLAMRDSSLAGVRSGLRGLSGGKGVTALEAEVGALCEAVERYCGTRQGDEPTVHDSLRGLGDQALHPNSCQLFDERQFRDRARWNAIHPAFQQICAPFDQRRPTDWTPVWSLTSRSHRLLPTSMLYYTPRTVGAAGGLPWADSNGNAAGTSLEDAVVQGFLELVERDAVALWWYNRTRRPAVDLDAFDQPWLAELRAAYGRMNRELWVLDLTSDFGVPVMAALSRRTDKPAEDIAFGFGAHFDPELALRRAITEMGQLLSPVAEAKADGTGYAVMEPTLLSWWTGATVTNQPYLLADPAESGRIPDSYGYVPQADLRQDVETAEALVRERGMELLVLDQTRPDAELPVVKVIVPGLRHYWARFAPGRLFDVPVQLGLRDRRTPYHELNPIPMFA